MPHIGGPGGEVLVAGAFKRAGELFAGGHNGTGRVFARIDEGPGGLTERGIAGHRRLRPENLARSTGGGVRGSGERRGDLVESIRHPGIAPVRSIGSDSWQIVDIWLIHIRLGHRGTW